METDRSKLVDDAIYKTRIPNIIIILSSIYICSYSILLIKIIFRKQQQRIDQMEKQRLRDYWERSTIQHQSNDAIADNQEKGLIAYPSSTYQPSNSSMTLQNTTSCNSSSSNTSGSSTSSIQHDNRQLVKFWSKKKTSKRLSLVWHWSVSMGYCEYDHGKELNELIKKLTKE